MTLKQIEYFVRVAELSSYTLAARALKVAQPTLSRQIRDLEVDLHQSLLLRNGRGVTLTDAGKRLLEHGRGIIHQVLRAQDDVMGRDAVSGRVAVGLPPSIARLLSVPIVREFRAMHPLVELSLSEAPTATIREWLLLGRLDVCLIYGETVPAGLQCTPLIQEEVVLIGPREPGRRRALPEIPGPTVSVRRLSGLPLVLPTSLHSMRRVVEDLLVQYGATPQIGFEIDGVVPILEMVREGFGYAVLPMSALWAASDRDRYVHWRLVRPRATITMSAAVSSRRPTSPSQRAALDLLQSLVKSRLGPGGEWSRRSPEPGVKRAA